MTIEVTISMDEREPYTLIVSHRKHTNDQTEITEREFLKSGVTVIKCIEDMEVIFIEVIEKGGMLYSPIIKIAVNSDSANGVLIGHYDEDIDMDSQTYSKDADDDSQPYKIEEYIIGAAIPGGHFDCTLYEAEHHSRCVWIQSIHNKNVKKFTEEQKADRYKIMQRGFDWLHL